MEPCPHFAVITGPYEEKITEEPLCFRSTTKCRLEVRAKSQWALDVKVTLDGDATDLKAAVWTEDANGENFDKVKEVLWGVSYGFYKYPPPSRVCCKVWTENCAICEWQKRAAEAAEAEKTATKRTEEAPHQAEQSTSQVDPEIQRLEHALAEQRARADGVEQELRSLIEALDGEAEKEKQRCEALAKENRALTASNTALGIVCKKQQATLQQTAEVHEEVLEQQLFLIDRIEVLKAEVEEEQTRFCSLQRGLEGELEERKKKAYELVGELADGMRKLEAVKQATDDSKVQDDSRISGPRQSSEDQMGVDEKEAASEWPLPADRAPLWAMQLTGELTDFRLLVDKEEIKVHKLVLALKSAFFAAEFRFDPTNTHYSIAGTSGEVLQRMVEFAYRGRLDGLERDARELLDVGRKFEIPDLIAACSTALGAEAGDSNDDETTGVLPATSIMTSDSFDNLPPPHAPTEAKEWHSLFTDDLRNQQIAKLLKSFFPLPPSAGANDQRVRDLTAYARKVESDFFSLAASKEQYDHWMEEKSRKIERELAEKRRLKERMQRASDQPCTSF